MAEPFSATGAKIFIGPSVAATPANAAAYAALSYVEIGNVTSIGGYGDESADVTINILGDGRRRRGKGSRDAGLMAINVAWDSTDAGQAALKAAEESTANFAFKVVLPNRLNATGTDEIDYFEGLIMSRRGSDLQNDQIATKTFNVAINSGVVEVPPTAGS